ncbi:MAG: hypothetical protein II077_05520, partial [Treponema sp.]|nr:hypothetical protein [Treponema sp.]
DVYLQKPVIAVLDTAIYPQICKKDCHVFSQRILPREQAKVCDCHPELLRHIRTHLLRTWIQHLYKLSIYRPQIQGQARNDVYLQKPVIAVSQAHSHVKRKVSNIRIPVTE